MILIFTAFVFFAAIGLAVVTRDFSSLVRAIAFVVFLVVCVFFAAGMAKRESAYEAIHTCHLDLVMTDQPQGSAQNIASGVMLLN